MQSLIVFILYVCTQTACGAGDLPRLKLGEAWEQVTFPTPKTTGWTWHTWQSKRGDRLTIAFNSTIGRSSNGIALTSHGDLDRAMDFASSAYPDWLSTNDFPSWRDPDHDFSPKFLTLETDTTRLNESIPNSKRVPTISYVMVNDDDLRSFMVIGRVLCIRGRTCYIPHNSKRPISDDTVIGVLRSLLNEPHPQ